ncbi:PREDICTED: oxysterol-binding protein 1 isoform X2 [Nicrophorus vespilloides]|uniref:Oxysterol-binding protein 1 isoform X2 n=1 Tax=Nicrophorus vespilloides TaxID=110193 RepID=A0ABM1MQB3_NICVS|nr:PREDICTED: oxysterol-binding protein 1 isoform X2 [Nicrophorus vespilloides]
MSDVVSVKGQNASSSLGGQNDPDMKGWLFKWTNYLKGYQRRWFVLQNGLLSYYRNQAEMTHTCRGSISLHGALIYPVDACTFVISNGGTQTFHIRAASEVERQCWVTALELAKAKAIRNMESEEDEEEQDAASGSPEEWSSIVRELQSRLEDLQTCSDLIGKHGAALQRALGELEMNVDQESAQGKSKAVSERATLFRIASNAMINACSEYLSTAQTHGHKWTRLLQHEREQRQRLQEMVETLAQQHSKLEQAAAANAKRPNGPVSASEEEEDENEFYDAVADGYSSTEQQQFTLNIPTGASGHRRHSSDSSSETDDTTQETHQVVVRTSNLHEKRVASGDGKEDKFEDGEFGEVAASTSRVGLRGGGARSRRTTVPEKPNYPLNLWSIVKNCIGKDLSKIPMPVNFSEPLSMLQRLAEDFEYADILDKAATCTDVCEQLAYVAAFTISSYSTTSSRTGKPFNPLLGETFEFDRSDDLGWKLVSEQVSHHPPMVAQHCEGRGWICWQEFTMTSKFRGKYLQVVPLGTATVEFANGNKFSWRKVTTTVHNIIVGKLWVDQHGDMDIVGKDAAEGITCHLKYVPYSYFSKDSQRRVKGAVMDTSDTVKWIINGTWDDRVDVSQVTKPVSGSNNNSVYETGAPALAWKRNMPDKEAEKYYGFTLLASQLNEPEDGVAPTDSRLRPDQRLMENGEWDDANKEKLRLEEKQRAARRRREAEVEKAAIDGEAYPPYEPIWFKQVKDDNDSIVHVYKGNYWTAKKNQDWANCPDIF